MLSINLNIMKVFILKKYSITAYKYSNLVKENFRLIYLVNTINKQVVTLIILIVTYLDIHVRDLFKTMVEDHEVHL